MNSDRKKVYHYCDGAAHLANCQSTMIVAEQPPKQLDDRTVLMEFNIPCRLMSALGEGRYCVPSTLAGSFPHRVVRVTFWHVCDPVSHAHCAASAMCRVETQPEREAHQLIFRLHPRRTEFEGDVDEVTWVPESQQLGTGHYEVSGQVLAREIIPVEGKIVTPVPASV